MSEHLKEGQIIKVESGHHGVSGTYVIENIRKDGGVTEVELVKPNWSFYKRRVCHRFTDAHMTSEQAHSELCKKCMKKEEGEVKK